jgi:Fic family protein
VQVYISGVEWMPPPPWDVPKGIRNLLSWYSRNKGKLHPLVLASYFHVGFEMVHPFVDGNGRVGRLLMNLILHRHGYPMINIPNEEKFRYYHTLEAMQDDGDLRPFVEYMVELMGKGEVLF